MRVLPLFYSTWVGEGWQAAAPEIQVPYVRTCRRKGLVSGRWVKKIVRYFSPWARMRTALRYWTSLEAEILSAFYLPHYRSSSAVLNQCLWVCCPPERTSDKTGVRISFSYDLHTQVRSNWVFLITSCHFNGQSISSPFLPSHPFLPLSFLPILFSLYYPLVTRLNLTSTSCSLNVSVCWLSPLKRFVEFVFWNLMC